MKSDFLPTLEAAQDALAAHSCRIRRSIVHLLKVMQSTVGFALPGLGMAIGANVKSGV